jgi:hypothetical protein
MLGRRPEDIERKSIIDLMGDDMRARAQATVRVWKKRSELQAHLRFAIQDGCGLPVATGAVS